jgi:hypothetical protein
MRNLNAEMRSGKSFKQAIIFRDRRCKQISGKMSKEYIEEFGSLGGVFLNVGSEEVCALNAIYDTLVAIEEHDLSLGKHEIDKKQFVQYLRSEGTCRRTQLFRAAATRSPCVGRAVGNAAESSVPQPKQPPQPPKPANGWQTQSLHPGEARPWPGQESRGFIGWLCRAG